MVRYKSLEEEAAALEGTRMRAPNPRAGDEMQDMEVLDVLSVMYFVRFDSGNEEFVYKVACRDIPKE